MPLPPLAAALDTPWWAWVIFGVLILGMLALDLFWFNRTSHVKGLREAAVWTVVWIGLAVLFGAGVWIYKGQEAGAEFAAAYLLEKALSVDNIFIFIVIFRFFGVPTVYQHRVLFWGILGALVMRAVMIGLGVGLLQHFHWLIFVFGGFLIYTGVKLLFSGDEVHEPSKTWAYKMTRRIVPMTDIYEQDRFFTRSAGKRVATPLFLVLVVVESTDLIFAIDSIPACIGVVRSGDLFVIYTSNIFAILGLRALYFLLAGAMSQMHYLKPALSAVLVFVGVKMILAEVTGLHLDPRISLSVVAGLIGLGVAASLTIPPRKKPPESGGELATATRPAESTPEPSQRPAP